MAIDKVHESFTMIPKTVTPIFEMDYPKSEHAKPVYFLHTPPKSEKRSTESEYREEEERGGRDGTGGAGSHRCRRCRGSGREREKEIEIGDEGKRKEEVRGRRCCPAVLAITPGDRPCRSRSFHCRRQGLHRRHEKPPHVEEKDVTHRKEEGDDISSPPRLVAAAERGAPSSSSRLRVWGFEEREELAEERETQHPEREKSREEEGAGTPPLLLQAAPPLLWSPGAVLMSPEATARNSASLP
ncbi:uncharacterized protein [Arachis hypogaea]